MTKYAHKEAFALMWYACKTCGHRERIWNSRDGVTPFGCGCPSCGHTIYHIEWRADECAPDHELSDGQRFWRDGTPDEAEKIILARIEKYRDKYPISDEAMAGLIKQARDGTEGEFRRGWPTIDTHQKWSVKQ